MGGVEEEMKEGEVVIGPRFISLANHYVHHEHDELL